MAGEGWLLCHNCGANNQEWRGIHLQGIGVTKVSRLVLITTIVVDLGDKAWA